MPEEDDQKDQQKVRDMLVKRMRENEMKKEIAKRYLTPEAYERLVNVKYSNQELYDQIIQVLISMAQSGRLTGKLDEKQLTALLVRLTEKPETKIEFRHK